MAHVLRTVIQLRRATTEEWNQYKTVIPAAGEPCYDITSGTLKIGDGIKTYEQLTPIGESGDVSISADGTSMVIVDDVFKLAGFDVAATGAQPRKNSDGKLEWFVPEVSTESIVTSIQDLQTRIQEVEDNINGNGDGSINAKIDAKINEFATNITDDNTTIDTFAELVNYVATHGSEVSGIMSDISALQSKVGDTAVSQQIESAISNIEVNGSGAIDLIKLGDASLDITNKTVTIPIGAGLKTSSEIIINEDGTLSISAIDMSKIVTSGDDNKIILDGGSAN